VDAWWPWWAMAASGALHGLGPANGWLLLAERSTGARTLGASASALLALAAGHLAALAIAAFVFVQGGWLDAALSRQCAAALLIALAAYRALDDALPGRSRAAAARSAASCARSRSCAAYAGLALWSGLAATGQGAGPMLLPALASLCADGTTGASLASGSIFLALAMVTVHLAAMLLVAGAVAAGIGRGLAKLPRWAGAARQGWTGVLAAVGVVLAIRS